MKNRITFIAIVMTSLFGYAQNGPKIAFSAKDNTIDYGTVSKKGDNGIRTIEFTNTGDAPLIISNVLSTPGFFIPSKPNGAINPGETGKIQVKYSMIPGPIRKTITVESNAVNYPGGRIPLKIKGEVIAD
jgi:multidrug efflux pump subunit AcrA (membrane-fusion protein)